MPASKSIGGLAALLVLVSVAPAQVSVEEAQAKLAQRRATTQPRADELSEYKQIVAELRKENAKLKAELAELRADLKRARETKTVARAAPDAPIESDPGKLLHAGMTVAEAQGALHTKFELVASDPDAQTYRGTLKAGTKDVMAMTPAGTYAWMPRSQQWNILLSVRDGKIAQFGCTKDLVALP